MPTFTPLIGRINNLGIDCTYRQLDYWCRLGYLGEHHRNLGSGSGSRRHFTASDLEVLHALAELAKLTSGTSIDRRAIAAALRARSVQPDGEVLIIDPEGTAQRFDHWCAVGGELSRGCFVLPLRSFASVLDGDVSPSQ